MVTPIFQNVSGMMSGLIISPICNKTGYMRGIHIGLKLTDPPMKVHVKAAGEM
jgi:hypothetical protein